MFGDPIFKIALGLSLFAHCAVVAPMHFFPKEHEDKEIKAEPFVELNYVIIEDPRLAEEETYSKSEVAEKILPEESVFTEIHETSVVPYDKYINKKIAFLEYYNLIREKIRAEIHSSGRKNVRGTVTATFTLEASGRLSEISNMVSDGLPTLERRVAKSIKRVQPFPPLPEELGCNPVRFSIIIKFIKS